MEINNLKVSNHLEEMMKERNLKIEWILNCIQRLDEQIDIAEEETHFYKIITDYQDK